MEIIVRVVEKLGPLIKKEVELHLNSDQEAKTLADNLENIQRLLDDAEGKQMSQPLVKKWLQDLQDLAYDIEDALEDWEARNEALQQQEEESSNPSPTTTWMEKICCFLHYPCSCFHNVVERRTAALDIVGLNQSVEAMYTKGKDELKLIQLLKSLATPDKVESVRSSSSYNWRITTSHFIKSKVKGRETDVKNVKKMLLFGDDLGEKQEVVCIVGGGGLGKTTVAKMIYDDDEVVRKFPKRIWVCVSDPFNENAIATEIYEQLEGQNPPVSGLQSIKEKIKESLREKSEKFLLVLDDVWTEKSEEWEPLLACLRHGAKGSKILVTTRKDNTAKAVGATKSSTYILKEMSLEDCWSIIRQKAFQQDKATPRFEVVGRKIAKKCNGSPLAANFLGGLLQDKTTEGQWEEVQTSEFWKMENVENEIFRHLFLSYNELKPAVKRCFAYCAVFPKDHKIMVDDLVKLWKAQGFASPTNASLTRENYCFNDLARRCFFQDLRKDKITGEIDRCKMHGIVHDFAMYLNKNARHLWWDHNLQQSILNSDVEKLRSLFCHGGLPAEDIIGRLKSVRALSLDGCDLEWIPEEIGNLIHLRYLDLRYNDMTELPETICNLCNLQALVIWRCWNLSKLPNSISKLRNLRYLICGMDNFDYTCEIANLIDLQQLAYIDVGKGCNDLRYLKDLDKLEGSLYITLSDSLYISGSSYMKLSDVEDVESAKTASLGKKTYLDNLVLDYRAGVNLQVVEALRPHLKLQSLEIRGRPLPNWISYLEHLGRLIISYNTRGQYIASNSIYMISVLKHIKTNLSDEDIWETTEHFEYFMEDYTVALERIRSKIFEAPEIIREIRFWNKLIRLYTDLENLRSEILEEDVRLTSWRTLLQNLRTEITDFENCCREMWVTEFPPLWKLPSLEYLKISGQSGVQSFVSSVSNFSDYEKVVAFPALKLLELEDDFEWTVWNEMEEAVTISGRFMPLLTDLEIRSCYNLESLPERTLQQLPSLRTLRIHLCWNLDDKYKHPRDGWTPKFEVIFE